MIDASTIFLRAQQAWVARAVPPYESFRIACDRTFLNGRCNPGDTVAFTVRASDGRTFAQTVPAAGGKPAVLLQGGFITGPAGTPLGFYRVLGGAPAALPPNLARDPLATIATVTAYAHVYDVTLAGEERVDGRNCYRLALRPQLDPDRFPLRELWVEESEYQIVQLTYERPYDERHTSALVHYRFAPVGNPAVWTIVHIDAQATIHDFLSTRVERVADDLDDISFPPGPPAWYFEPGAPAGMSRSGPGVTPGPKGG
ncbi:MAG: hypothetical protein WA814_06145 [Candidatus Baltobacteraceae bacterium]